MKSLIYSTIFAVAIATTDLPAIAQSQMVNYDPSDSRIVSTEIDRSGEAHQINLYVYGG